MLQVTEPVQKQTILVKLVDLMDNSPRFDGDGPIDAESPQRQWLSRVGALLKKLDPVFGAVTFETSMRTLNRYRSIGINQIKGQVSDAIEVLRLDLELVGRADIGNVYQAGEVYDLFSDLKAIIQTTTQELMLVDPYFNGEAFADYLSAIGPEKTIKIFADRYVEDVRTHAAKHARQHKTNIEIRRSDALHDRLVFVDNSDCWVVGGSIKDAAAKSPTYLVPLQPVFARAKLGIYSTMWDDAEVVLA